MSTDSTAVSSTPQQPFDMNQLASFLKTQVMDDLKNYVDVRLKTPVESTEVVSTQKTEKKPRKTYVKKVRKVDSIPTSTDHSESSDSVSSSSQVNSTQSSDSESKDTTIVFTPTTEKKVDEASVKKTRGRPRKVDSPKNKTKDESDEDKQKTQILARIQMEMELTQCYLTDLENLTWKKIVQHFAVKYMNEYRVTRLNIDALWDKYGAEMSQLHVDATLAKEAAKAQKSPAKDKVTKKDTKDKVPKENNKKSDRDSVVRKLKDLSYRVEDHKLYHYF